MSLFAEKVKPNITTYIPLFLLTPALYIVFEQSNKIVGIFMGIFVPISICFILYKQSINIKIDHNYLTVNEVSIEKKFLGKCYILDEKMTVEELGVNLNALAYAKIRFWCKTSIKIMVTDKEDQTPYIIISTRKAEKLCSILTN